MAEMGHKEPYSTASPHDRCTFNCGRTRAGPGGGGEATTLPHRADQRRTNPAPLHRHRHGLEGRDRSQPCQHKDQPADLRKECPEQEPEIVEVIGARAQGAIAQPGDQLGEIGALGLSLGDNLLGYLGLLRLQLGDFSLARLAGHRLAETPAARLVPLCRAASRAWSAVLTPSVW